MAMTFGKQLRNLIRRKGTYQYIIAKKLGVASRTVSHWIRGQHQPNFPMLCWLMEALDLKIWLVTPNGDKFLVDNFPECMGHIMAAGNIDVKELSERSGVPLTTTYDYRREYAYPKLTNLNKILTACNCKMMLEGDNLWTELILTETKS